MENQMELNKATREQLTAVIMIDCLEQCNALQLSREQYETKLREMLAARLGFAMPVKDEFSSLRSQFQSLLVRMQTVITTGASYADLENVKARAPTSTFTIYMGHFQDIHRSLTQLYEMLPKEPET